MQDAVSALHDLRIAYRSGDAGGVAKALDELDKASDEVDKASQAVSS